MSILKMLNVRVTSCFLWDKMKTIAQETASQITLRNCSREIWGKVRINVILVNGGCVQSSTYFFSKCFCQSQGIDITNKGFQCFSRYVEIQELGSYNQLLKISNFLKTSSASFSQSTECIILDLHSESLSGCIESQQLQQHDLILEEVDDRANL